MWGNLHNKAADFVEQQVESIGLVGEQDRFKGMRVTARHFDIKILRAWIAEYIK